MVKLSALQRNGLLTLSLLHSARVFVPPAADAVAFDRQQSNQQSQSFAPSPSTSTSLSERFRRSALGRFGRRSAALASSEGGGGGESEQDDVCVSGVCLPRKQKQLHRSSRRLLAKNKRVGEDDAGWRHRYEDCARERCPSCLDVAAALEVPRGGNLSGAASAASAAASATSSAAVTPFGLPLNLWKVLFQAVLTTLNVLCWLVPLKSDRISENKLGLSLANAFSGGVFLSLAFGHLIPECVHGFPPDAAESLPYMLVLAGYLLIFFVEKVAFDAHGLMHAGEEDKHGGRTGGQSKENGTGAKGDDDEEGSLNTGRSAVILLGALAVHSVLEMTALGLASTFGESALLSLSIALHQPAESIALLVAFLKSGMPKPLIIKYLSAFSAMGPCGVALGMAVQEFAAPVVDAVMLAVVAGTFVYVGATEVIPEEWEEQEHKWKKFGSLLAGIVSVFAVTQYTMTLEA